MHGNKQSHGGESLDDTLRAVTPPLLMAIGAMSLLRSRSSRMLGLALLSAWAIDWATQADRHRKTRRRDIASRRAMDDALDQANEDSFPASDPPSFSGTTAGTP